MNAGMHTERECIGWFCKEQLKAACFEVNFVRL